MPCFFCDGAAHPSTGCEYAPGVLACRRCVETFWRWAPVPVVRAICAAWSREGAGVDSRP